MGNGGGRERASATTFLWPGRCWKDALNSERKERWRCWREEQGVDCLLMVAKRSLWLVKGVKGWPSRKNEMFDGRESGQEFSVKRRITGFCCGKHWRKRKGVANNLFFVREQLPCGYWKHLLQWKGELWYQDVQRDCSGQRGYCILKKKGYFGSPGEAAFSFGG